uniref:Uncharacterized protein n=2 Tax=Clastoptera arizonana TaxID=38151 RepID=A0A1B6C4U8_9HEMI
MESCQNNNQEIIEKIQDHVNIITQEQTDQDCKNLDTSLEIILKFCGNGCCSKHILNTNQLLKLISKSAINQDYTFFKTNFSDVTYIVKNIVHNYNSYPEANGFIQNCIRAFLRSMKTKEEYDFLMVVWKSSYINELFPCELVELFIKCLPECIENDVISTVKDTLELRSLVNVWTQRNLRLIKWCSLSTNVFIPVTRILHQLIRSFVSIKNNLAFCLCKQFMSEFIKKVKESCVIGKQDFVLLYPRNLQGLIVMLEFEPNYLMENYNEAYSSTIDELNLYLLEKPFILFGLLLNFPAWQFVINHHFNRYQELSDTFKYLIDNNV